MTKSVNKYLADICTMKSCNVKNFIFSFFSQHGLIAPHTKFHVYQTSSSCFLQITSQIFEKNDQTKYSFKNIDSFASFKKRMSLFPSKLSIKLCFTFVNFWSFYFNCLSHSALVLGSVTICKNCTAGPAVAHCSIYRKAPPKKGTCAFGHWPNGARGWNPENQRVVESMSVWPMPKKDEYFFCCNQIWYLSKLFRDRHFEDNKFTQTNV